MKTKEQIEALKKEWELDPIWNIEESKGFEEYKKELLNFRLIKEKEWGDKKKEKVLSAQKEKLYSLNLGEFCYINGSSYTRVPGGWIFAFHLNGDNWQTLFLPMDYEFNEEK